MDTVLLKSEVTHKFNILLNDKSPLKQTALYKEHQVSRFYLINTGQSSCWQVVNLHLKMYVERPRKFQDVQCVLNYVWYIVLKICIQFSCWMLSCICFSPTNLNKNGWDLKRRINWLFVLLYNWSWSKYELWRYSSC